MIGYKETSVNGAKESETIKKSSVKTPGWAAIIGVALGIASVYLVEAVIVWVILAYLVKANVAFIQVLGAVLIFEYMRNRIKA